MEENAGVTPMEILRVENLSKDYKTFKLKDISFAIEPGSIVGMIGMNGAGKTTIIKAIYNLIEKTSGTVSLFGQNTDEIADIQLKQDVSLLLGGLNIFPQDRLKTITSAIAPFYKRFDYDIYTRLMSRFKLEDGKRFKELSNGMKTKYLLTLALSHHAKLLILDEPTSGLDPFSRDEILSIFKDFVKDRERAILFSTQIVSDLEQVADHIIYIKGGRLINSGSLVSFKSSYRLIQGPDNRLEEIKSLPIIGLKTEQDHFSALVNAKDVPSDLPDLKTTIPSIEEIMVLTERGDNYEDFNL